jgi:hypothetical protein
MNLIWRIVWWQGSPVVLGKNEAVKIMLEKAKKEVFLRS